MKKIKICSLVLAGLITTSLLTSCSNDKDLEQGTISLNITDAPTDAENVSGVFITITGVEYQKEGKSWQVFENFSGPVTLNLLELTEGKTSLLGDFKIEEGKYTGLRFKLDAAENGDSAADGVGAAYLELEDGSRLPLFVPSGTKSGYKAKGDFVVPVNSTVVMTADFDVRKSVVEAGKSGKYLLKPVIRLIVNNQAGTIQGTIPVTATEGEYTYVVYAYEAGTYNSEEAAEPASEEVRFPNAVSSAQIKEDGTFVLPFLAPGTYDLVIVSSLGGYFREVIKILPEAADVESLQTAEVEIIF